MRLLFAFRKDGATWGYAAATRALGGEARKMLPDEVLAATGYDAIIIDVAMAKCTPDFAHCKTPLIMTDDLDGSQLGDRKFIQWPSIKAVLKRSCLTPASRNNELQGRYHVHILKQHGVKAVRPTSQGKPDIILTDAELAKVYPLAGFGSHKEMTGVLRHDPELDAPRIHDAHFSGTTSYGRSEVQAHRIAAFEAVANWQGGEVVAHRNRVMPIGLYYGTMRKSRTVLSPWGWGETAYRDFGAMLTGAVLIKSDVSHIATWPEDTFTPGETYLPCKPMWENAHELIAKVKRDWLQMRPLRERAFAVAKRANNPAAMAARLKEILTEVL